MIINNLNILKYAEFLGLTLVFIVLVLRAFYYALQARQDPIKAVKPDLKNSGLYKWLVLREKIKENNKVGQLMS